MLATVGLEMGMGGAGSGEESKCNSLNVLFVCFYFLVEEPVIKSSLVGQ